MVLPTPTTATNSVSTVLNLWVTGLTNLVVVVLHNNLSKGTSGCVPRQKLYDTTDYFHMGYAWI